MKLKFETQVDGSYYEVTNENNKFGYTLTRYVKNKKPDCKTEYSTTTLFYGTLDQVVNKVIYLGLKGHNMEEILLCYNEMVERITETLHRELRSES